MSASLKLSAGPFRFASAFRLLENGLLLCANRSQNYPNLGNLGMLKEGPCTGLHETKQSTISTYINYLPD